VSKTLAVEAAGHGVQAGDVLPCSVTGPRDLEPLILQISARWCLDFFWRVGAVFSPEQDVEGLGTVFNRHRDFLSHTKATTPHQIFHAAKQESDALSRRWREYNFLKRFALGVRCESSAGVRVDAITCASTGNSVRSVEVKGIL
jgi:hypothetical protein